MPKKETILVMSAHSDDFVIGAGGTIKNYTDDGKRVMSIVFSYGEQSHPWLKEMVIQKMRAKEALDASTLLGCQTYVYNLKEFQFTQDAKEKKFHATIMGFISKYKPTKIFTHSQEDPHPDHKAVHKITMDVFADITGKKPEVYTYSIWNPVSFKTNYPSLYVNVTKSFRVKLKALKTFRSQKIHVAYPLFLLLYRAIKNGLKMRKRFGEQFYRIK
jgi:LmbE family N-acetylglucosaminyl deacetylase